MSDDEPTVTFGPLATETIVEAFGWRVVDGVVMKSTGNTHPTT